MTLPDATVIRHDQREIPAETREALEAQFLHISEHVFTVLWAIYLMRRLGYEYSIVPVIWDDIHGSRMRLRLRQLVGGNKQQHGNNYQQQQGDLGTACLYRAPLFLIRCGTKPQNDKNERRRRTNRHQVGGE